MSGERSACARAACRTEPFLVTLPTSGDLFISGKDLFVEAIAPQAPPPKTFEIDQSFEPGACTRRPTAIGAAQKMSGTSMSDEFDSQMQARRPVWRAR